MLSNISVSIGVDIHKNINDLHNPKIDVYRACKKYRKHYNYYKSGKIFLIKKI